MLMLGVSHALAGWLVVKVLAVFVRAFTDQRGDDDGCEHSTGATRSRSLGCTSSVSVHREAELISG